MSETSCPGVLAAALYGALLSALLLLGAVREALVGLAWLSAAGFVACSLVAAWCFWGLV